MIPAATSNAILKVLTDELHELARLTLVLSGQCRFRRRAIPGRPFVWYAFLPVGDEGTQIAANRRRFDQWANAAIAAVSRRGAAEPDLTKSIRELAKRVSLEWIDTPYTTRQRSVAAFSEDVQRLSSTVVRILTKHLQQGNDASQDASRGNYDTFALRITGSDEEWTIEADWEDLEAEARTRPPFTTAELREFRETKLAPPVPDAPHAVPEAFETLCAFGERLFQHTFLKPIAALFEHARADVADRGRGLRIAVLTESGGALSLVPWELLYDGVHFLGLSSNISITRRIGVTPLARPLRAANRPFRLLVTVSTVGQRSLISREAAIAKIETAVAPLVMLGSVRLDITQDGSLAGLQRALSAAREEGMPYDAWHFAGHGELDDHERSGAIAMTGRDGRKAHWLGPREIATVFSGDPQVRLVVLNACNGADGDRSERWSSAASAFLRAGIPAVAAMQLEISYDAAATFDTALYGALAAGATIDDAVTAARCAVFSLPNYVEWIRPVLFLRGEEVVSL